MTNLKYEDRIIDFSETEVGEKLFGVSFSDATHNGKEINMVVATQKQTCSNEKCRKYSKRIAYVLRAYADEMENIGHIPNRKHWTVPQEEYDPNSVNQRKFRLMDINEVAIKIASTLADNNQIQGTKACVKFVTGILSEQTNPLKVLEENKWDLRRNQHPAYPIGEYHVTEQHKAGELEWTHLISQGKTPSKAIENAIENQKSGK